MTSQRARKREKKERNREREREREKKDRNRERKMIQKVAMTSNLELNAVCLSNLDYCVVINERYPIDSSLNSFTFSMGMNEEKQIEFDSVLKTE